MEPETAGKAAGDVEAVVRASLEKGEVEEARALFDDAFRRWSTHPKLILLKGEVLAHSTSRRDAIFYYAALLGASYGMWAAHRLAALLRDTALPIGDAEELALQVSESSLDTKLKKVILDILIARENPDESLQVLEIAGAKSGIIKYESKLATRKAEGGDFAGALAILETARAEGRGWLHSDFLLADLYAVQWRIPESVAVLQDLLEQHPDQPDVYRRLTVALERASQFERANDVLESAIRRWPSDWMLIHRFNRVEIAPERLESIFLVISKLGDEALNKNDRLRFQVALACLHTGRVGRAFDLLRRPFQEPVTSMSVPVVQALSGRPFERWIRPPRLADDRTKDVQITRAPDARATVIVTTGIVFGNLPLSFMDMLIADHDLNAVYLRDFNKRAYLRGVASLGADEEQTIAALQRLVAELGAKRTIVMGSSSGGFSAMRYGALLGADAAVSFAGPASVLDAFEGTRQSVWNSNMFVRPMLESEPDLPVDLVPLLAKTSRTRFFQFYGEQAEEDIRHARRLEGLSNVRVVAVPDVSDHFVVDHMIGRGLVDTLLEELAVP